MGYFQTTRLQNGSQGRRRNAFAQRRNHAAGYKNVFGHHFSQMEKENFNKLYFIESENIQKGTTPPHLPRLKIPHLVPLEF